MAGYHHESTASACDVYSADKSQWERKRSRATEKKIRNFEVILVDKKKRQKKTSPTGTDQQDDEDQRTASRLWGAGNAPKSLHVPEKNIVSKLNFCIETN